MKTPTISVRKLLLDDSPYNIVTREYGFMNIELQQREGRVVAEIMFGPSVSVGGTE